MQPDAEDLAEGNWESILLHAGLDPSFLLRRHGPCPVCGGKDRYRWRPAKESGFCNSCRHLGGFSILRSLLGDCEFKEAADYVRKWRGGVPASALQPKKAVAPEDDAAKRETLRIKYKALWDEGTPVAADGPAGKYLTSRIPGITEFPKTLRSHKGMDYWEVNDDNKFHKVGCYPGLLAAAQGANGTVSNIWRIYLNEDGSKANVANVKKGSGMFLQPGFAVRLGEPTGDELGIAEGIETALAVSILFGIPCWAALNSWGVKNFEIPETHKHVKRLRIFGDNDMPDQRGYRAGNEAAKALKDRMSAAGIKSSIILPRGTSFDFADMLKNRGAPS